MGRPLKPIDPRQVDALAIIGCRVHEMAAVLECGQRTLDRRFGEIIRKGKEKAKSSLRRKQWELAMNGNATMLIWLGKQMLGQSDKQEISGPEGAPIEIRSLSDDDLQARINRLLVELGLAAQVGAAAVVQDDASDPSPAAGL